MRYFQNKLGSVFIGAAALAFGLASTASATPGTQAAPRGCGDHCTEQFTHDLGAGTVLTGYRPHSPSGHSSYVTVTKQGRLTSSTRLGDVTPGSIDYLEHGSCSSRAGKASCVVTGGTGAHSESAIVFTVDVHSGSTHLGNSVLHGSPDTRVADLDRDGTPDVAMRESTYEPNYAEAPQYWVSYVVRDDKLLRTGCTAPSNDSQPTPTSPLTGKCYA